MKSKGNTRGCQSFELVLRNLLVLNMQPAYGNGISNSDCVFVFFFAVNIRGARVVF